MTAHASTFDTPQDRSSRGPFDESEVSGIRPWIDLGSIKLMPRDGLNLRLEVEEGTNRVVAASLDLNGSTLQIQPFASRRSGGLWGEIRAQLQSQLLGQGAEVIEVQGPLGIELRANVPVVTATGEQVLQPARFIGVDGPRWFLRGVIAGPAAIVPDQGEMMIEVFRGLVVVRGQQPLPPRELLPLQVPAQVGGGL